MFRLRCHSRLLDVRWRKAEMRNCSLKLATGAASAASSSRFEQLSQSCPQLCWGIFIQLLCFFHIILAGYWIVDTPVQVSREGAAGLCSGDDGQPMRRSAEICCKMNHAAGGM